MKDLFISKNIFILAHRLYGSCTDRALAKAPTKTKVESYAVQNSPALTYRVSTGELTNRKEQTVIKVGTTNRAMYRGVMSTRIGTNDECERGDP